MRLNEEEINLVCVMNVSSRNSAIQDLKRWYLKMDHKELQDICVQTIKKLEAMTDEVFSEYDFAAYMKEYSSE